MIPLGLSAPDTAALERQMRATSQVRVQLRLLDLEHGEQADLSDRLLEGQVNIDTSGETDRQLSCTFDDPRHSLSLDSDAPGDGALYADRMLQASYGFYVPALGRWVDVPIFTGPIATMNRDGGQVQVSCLGKEHLAGGQAWRPLTLKKGMNTGDAIRAILRERAGERRFAFATSKHRLPKAFSLGRMDSPWIVARSLAESIGRHLYYDGAGVCRLRRAPATSLFTFGGTLVLSNPRVSYDLANVVNTVWVKGHKPKGKDRVTAVAVAPRNHPLSPFRLGRDGEPRHIVAVVERDGVRSKKDANQLAKRTLAGGLREGVTCEFDSLPVVHLDPLDVVRLDTDEASLTFVLRQASLPLTHDGSMSVGALKRVSPNKRIRR